MKILVVDNDENTRVMIEDILKMVVPPGSEILFALNGKEGLDILQHKGYVTAPATQDFDLLITDVKMPIMDGITMLREVKRLGIGPKHIFIISAEELDELLLQELGVTEYFQKPYISVQQITLAIQKIFP